MAVVDSGRRARSREGNSTTSADHPVKPNARRDSRLFAFPISVVNRCSVNKRVRVPASIEINANCICTVAGFHSSSCNRSLRSV